MALVLSGSIDISGSMTATTIVVSSPGAAGMVSSSAQITELAPLMAYTASIKAASIVSSSQQIQNYFTFARTGSANTFYGNQTISASFSVHQPLTNTTSYLTIKNNRARNAAVYTETTNGGFYAGTSIGTDTFNYQIYDAVAGSARLTFASTGAATFSGSVTAPYYLVTNNIPSSTASTGYLDYSGGGTRLFSVGTSGATKGTFRFIAKGADDSALEPLGISTTGVSTFTSTSTAMDTLTVCNSSGKVNVKIGGAGGGANYGGIMMLDISSNERLYLITDATAYSYMYSGLVIGDGSGAYKLTLNGQPGANGYTAWTNYSDRRLKENIEPLVDTSILNKINLLNPVTFNYNEASGYDEKTRERRISGFIAQELQEIFPEMVGNITLNGEEYLDTNLSNLSLYLVKAIQEQQAIIDGLIARIEALENN